MKISAKGKGNLIKVVAISLAVLVGLGSMGIGYAHYSGGWGKWGKWNGWRFDRPIVHSNNYDCDVAFYDVYTEDNEWTFDEPKEVAQTTAEIDPLDDTIINVLVDNAYPGCIGYVYFTIKNTGAGPIMVTGISTTNNDPGFQTIDLITSFIVGTELGIIHRLEKENPDKHFVPATEQAVCPNMKLITLEQVLWALEEMQYRIEVPQQVRSRAEAAVQRMIASG